MSIPYARRLPIPELFRGPSFSTEKSQNGDVKSNIAITNSVSSFVLSSSPSRLLPSPPIPSSRRNYILPAPSEKKVKYASPPRECKVISKGFVRPKSPPPPPPNFDDQNRSPVQTLGSASGDSTFVASTPPLFKEKDSFKVLREKTNSLSPPLSESKTLVHHGDGMSKEISSPNDTPTTDTNEKHVLTAISTSIDGNMNMDANIAHLETAASLRSIRGTLNQLKKNRSQPRLSRSTHAKNIFIHDNEIFSTKDPKDKQDVSVSPPKTKAPEMISDIISQLLRHRFRPDHRGFMTTWSAAEIKIYNARWDKLVEKSKSVNYWPIARFSEIPWPVLPYVVISSSSPDIITRKNVARFLLCPHRDQQSTSLERIFAEIERWNDFHLMGRVLRNVREADRKKVETAWSNVVLVLMEMRGDCMAGRSPF